MIYVFISALLAGFMSLGAYMLAQSADTFDCESKAEALRVAHRSSLTKGCMLEIKPGVWAPVGALKVILEK